MWSLEAIGRKNNVFGYLIAGKLGEQMDKPSLDICVVIKANFGYPRVTKVCIENLNGCLPPEVQINIKYFRRRPFYSKCRGYNNWTSIWRINKNDTSPWTEHYRNMGS